MSDPVVYCPECDWEDEIDDVTGEWPKFCPSDGHDGGLVRTEVDSRPETPEHTKTDKI